MTLDHRDYRDMVRTFTESLVHADLAPRDLTVAALGLRGGHAEAAILARAGGVVAGLAELAFLLQSHGIVVAFEKKDGDAVRAGRFAAARRG